MIIFKQLILLATLLVSLMVSPVAHADWTWMGYATGNSLYVDFEKIRRANGRVYYWMLMDYLEPEKDVHSTKVYFEAECGQFRQKLLSSSFYSSAGGLGKPISTNNIPDKQWMYPRPKSATEVILDKVCNYKP